jgi:hypothetical protein
VRRQEQQLRTGASNISCKELGEQGGIEGGIDDLVRQPGGIRGFEMILEETKMQGPGTWMDIEKHRVRASRTRKAKRGGEDEGRGQGEV